MAKTKETFTRFDTADYLETEEDIAAYLSACAEEDDPALLLAALGGCGYAGYKGYKHYINKKRGYAA